MILCQNAIKTFYAKSSQTCSFRRTVHTVLRQATKGIIFKPEHLVVAHKTKAEDDRLEKEMRSTSGVLHPVEGQLALQGHSFGAVLILV